MNMKIFARVLLALLFALAACNAIAASPAAAVPGAGIRARLVDTPVLRGKFEQEKHLQGFRNPLLSKGDFLLARDRGVVWNTRSPFPSAVVLTKQRLLSRAADGSTRDLGGRGASPAVATANTLLMALLGGNVEMLGKQFDLSETLVADGSWTLVLVPKPGPLQKIFRRIELQGDRHVRSVRLEEVAGDRTDIRFLELRDAPVKLDGAEAKQFD